MTEASATDNHKDELLRLLVEAGKVDTAFRDVYLHHALSILEPLFPYSEYRRISTSLEQLDDFIRRSRLAADKGDWEGVREAAERISYLRSLAAENEVILASAKEVYQPADVVIDPFSPGLEWTHAGRKSRELRGKVVDILTRLEAQDGPSSRFYQERLEHYREPLSERPQGESQEKAGTVDTAALQRESLHAAERGDLAALDRLLGEMQDAGVTTRRENGGRRPPEQRSISGAFEADTVGRAASLGLIEAEVPAAPHVSDFLWQRAWQPNIPDQSVAQDGHLRLLGASDLPAEVPDPLREVLEMFLLHVFVNSAGVRYLPALGAERFLVEDFSEDDPDAADGVLPLLGLPKRRGLSRVEIETALLHRGADILRSSLGLDPCRFRLVCIPYDLYARLGMEKGWGMQQFWTHFDGYQLLKGGGVRALVGGDARYGGIYDLCTISDFDARERVTARFAVVHRDRMLIPSR